MADKRVPITRSGPPLGNVQTQDSYLRIKQNIDGLQETVGDLSVFLQEPKPITVDQLEQIKKSLSAGGDQALNVTGLAGILLQPQLTNLPEVQRLPPRGSSTEGQTVLFEHTIWRFSANATRGWEEVSIICIQDDHANLTLYDANNYGPGVLFYKTDWKVFYINQLAIDANNNTIIHLWNYGTGIYEAPVSVRPSNLNLTDTKLLFFARDWQVGWRWNGSDWQYLWGEYMNVLSAIPTPTANEVGFLFGATDYFHRYRWSGNGWSFAAGDPGSGYIVGGTAVPVGGLWAPCNGGVATVALQNGTTGAITTPNMTNGVFVMGGLYTGNVQAANRATWDPSAATDGANLTITTADENNHTHPIQKIENTFVLSPITFNAGNSNATLSYNSAQADVSNNSTDAGSPHNHAANATPNPHAHNLSNNNAVLNAPSENNGGLPARIAIQWYMRR